MSLKWKIQKLDDVVEMLKISLAQPRRELFTRWKHKCLPMDFLYVCAWKTVWRRALFSLSIFPCHTVEGKMAHEISILGVSAVGIPTEKLSCFIHHVHLEILFSTAALAVFFTYISHFISLTCASLPQWWNLIRREFIAAPTLLCMICDRVWVNYIAMKTK